MFDKFYMEIRKKVEVVKIFGKRVMRRMTQGAASRFSQNEFLETTAIISWPLIIRRVIKFCNVI